MEIFTGAMQELVDGIRQSADERAIAVQEIRNDAQEFVRGLQLENSERAEATREKLSSDEEARLKEAQGLRDERVSSNESRIENTKQFMDEIRNDIAGGQRVWAERNSNGNGSTAGVPCEEKVRKSKKKTKKTKKAWDR